MSRQVKRASPSKRVLFALYAHPAGFPPVERAAELLTEANWQVKIIGAKGIETDALAAPTCPGVEMRLVSRAGGGFAQKARYLRFLAVCAANIVRWKPQWVYVSDSFAAPIGVLAGLIGFRVLYHEHDAPVHSQTSVFVGVILRARRLLLRRALLVVTPNVERSASISVEAAGRKVITVWNCPRRSEVVVRTGRARGDAALRVVYHGSIVPGRTPLSLIDALARVEGVELDISGYETIGSRGITANLRARAREVGVSDRLRLRPAQPRKALLAHAAECDLGIAFMPISRADFNERTMAGASNKTFEYLACSLPLLVAAHSDLDALFVGNGVALACNPEQPADIARVLASAAVHRAELAAMGARGRELIEDKWNYETQFRPLLSRMERIAAGRLGGRHRRPFTFFAIIRLLKSCLRGVAKPQRGHPFPSRTLATA